MPGSLRARTVDCDCNLQGESDLCGDRRIRLAIGNPAACSRALGGLGIEIQRGSRWVGAKFGGKLGVTHSWAIIGFLGLGSRVLTCGGSLRGGFWGSFS